MSAPMPSEVARPRQYGPTSLVYAGEPIDFPCMVCGVHFSTPCELLRTALGLAHVECIADGDAATRGGG